MRLQIAYSFPFLLKSCSRVPVRSEPEHARQAYGRSRALQSRWNQEKKGGARGGAQGSSAAGSCGSEKSSRTGPEAGIGQRSASAEPEIAAPRSGLKGHSVQCEGRAPLPGVSPGKPSPPCFWPVALHTSEGSAGTFGLAFASSGQEALSAMPASASQAAMRLRKRCAFIAAFLAQMRGLFQRWFWYSPLRHEGKTGRPAPAHRAGAIHLRLEFSESGLLLVPALGPRARGDRFRRRGKRAPSPGGARRAHRP